MGLEDCTQEKLFCKKFGFEIAESNCKNSMFDYMVLGNKIEIPKTYTAAMTMLQGKPIIDQDWIIECLREGKVLDHSKFQMKYDATFRKSNEILSHPHHFIRIACKAKIFHRQRV